MYAAKEANLPYAFYDSAAPRTTRLRDSARVW